jgi:hypothetical protein
MGWAKAHELSKLLTILSKLLTIQKVYSKKLNNNKIKKN